MKTIIFDIWGDWAHFKKFYTTASPLSFHFPPITAIKGIVGSILGLSKNKKDKRYYIRELNGLLCGIQIINPIKTFRMGYNWIETKKAKYLSQIPSAKGRYQTVIETIKDPYYRIFIAQQNNVSLIENIKNLLQDHRSIYTPYLGITEHIANFKFITEAEAVLKESNDFIEIHSIIPIDKLIKKADEDKGLIIFQEGKIYQRERIPVTMNEDRIVTSYESVLYEMNAKSIIIRAKHYWELSNGTNIYFFK